MKMSFCKNSNNILQVAEISSPNEVVTTAKTTMDETGEEKENVIGEVPTTQVMRKETVTETKGDSQAASAEKLGEEIKADAEAENAEKTGSPSKEDVSITESITAAPGLEDTQFTTTSVFSTTLSAETSPTKHRRVISKIDAANEFVYGHLEETWSRTDRKASVKLTAATFRPNRAQTMRESCIMKRALQQERERRTTDEGRSSGSEPENEDPVIARPVPKFIYEDPKIRVKDTKSSKFRYLFNRKPPGVKVYFKPANADHKKKPPFVVSVVHS